MAGSSTTALELLIRTKLDAQAFTDLTGNLTTIRQHADGIDLTALNPTNFINSAEQLSIVKTRIMELTREMEKMRVNALQATAKGELFNAEVYTQEAEGIKRVIDGLKEYTNSADKAAEHNVSLFETFTKLGFQMLIFENSIKTFLNAMTRVYDFASEGAGIADRAESFNLLTSGIGLSAQQMRTDLEDAAGGLSTFTEASKGTIQLIQAGLPGAAGYSDELLRIAQSAAILQGDISKTGYIMNSLTTGIVRDSPRLIDNANILLKLGEVYEGYAKSIGKTADELTILERKEAVLFAVLEQGERMNEMADNVDSYAASLQKLTVIGENAADMLKTGFGIALANLAEGLGATETEFGKFNLSVSSTRDLVNTSTGGMELMTHLMSSLEGWATLVGMAFIMMGKGIEAVIAFIQALAGQISAAMLYAGGGIKYLATEMGILRGEAAMTNEELVTLRNQFADTGWGGENSPFLAMGKAFDSRIEAYDSLLQAAGILTKPVDSNLDFSVDNEENTKKAEELAEKLRDIERDKQRTLADLARDGARDRKDADTDLARELVDINRDLADELADAARDYQRDLADMRRDYAQELLDIEQDLADDLRDIDVDLARDLADETSKAQEDRLTENVDYSRKREAAEEDHQKKIADIMRKYEASRRVALQDRDARGLADAKAALDSDLESANETYQDKMEDIETYHKDKMEEIKRQEEDERQSAIDAAEQKRADAKADAERTRRDAAAEHIRKMADKQREYEEERRDAQTNADRKRRDAAIEHDREMADLRLQNQRRLEEIATEYRRELEELDGYYQERISKTSEYVQQEIRQYEVLNTAHKSLIPTVTVTQGTGDGGLDPGGTPWPDPTNPANVRPGVACQYSSVVRQGYDGQQYHCIGGIWSLVGGAGFNSVAGAANTVSGGGVTIPTFGANGISGGRQVLTIKSENDDLLAKILNEVAYEAIIEVIR